MSRCLIHHCANLHPWPQRLLIVIFSNVCLVPRTDDCPQWPRPPGGFPDWAVNTLGDLVGCCHEAAMLESWLKEGAGWQSENFRQAWLIFQQKNGPNYEFPLTQAKYTGKFPAV